MSSEDVDELIEEEASARRSILATEEFIDRAKEAHHIHPDENPRFMDKVIDGMWNNPDAAEVLELLDGFEEMSPQIVEYIRELLEEGSEFEKKHPHHAKLVQEFLRLYRKLKLTMKEDRSQKIGA
mgnify:FL=1